MPLKPQPHQRRPSLEDGERNIRAYAACRSCRTKKIKCTPPANATPGESPCSQCITAGLECIYPPSRDRAAFSRQYVQSLESRVQSLEVLAQRTMPLLQAYERDNPQLAYEAPEGIGETLPPRPERTHSDDAGQMTQDERGNYRWLGSSNTFSLLDSFSHEPQDPSPSRSESSNPYFGPIAGSGVVKALPGVDEVEYPHERDAHMMVDAYFEEVHPVLPVVIEQEFRRDFLDLMARRASGRPQSSSGGFITVVFAVFALGERAYVTSRAWQREKQRLAAGSDGATVQPGEAEAGVIWYERAQILHYSTLKDVNIRQVQCLTLMAAFQASVNAMPMSWLLVGQAMRVAQDLGLHRATARIHLSFKERQMRARCWWAIYGLDRMVSIALGRPLGVDDLDIDVPYPAEIDDAALLRVQHEDPPLADEAYSSTMSGFVSLTKLCRLAGRVAHVLYRPSNGRSVHESTWASNQLSQINKLDKLLKEWLEKDVPKKYKDHATSRSVAIVSAVLSSSYFAVLITLHRNFLPASPTFPRPKQPPSSVSLTQCVDAARSVIHTASHARVVVPPSHHLAVFCQYLWSSAVILLLCEVQARDQVVIDAVATQVEECRRALQALEPVWPGSRKLKLLLNDVERRAKEVTSSEKRKRKSTSRDVPPKPSVSPLKTTPQGDKQPRVDQPADNFDLGGINFDGLDLLQGFSAEDTAAFFATMFPAPLEAVPQNVVYPMPPPQPYVNTTPTSGHASGGGPSPIIPPPANPAEFWGQVGGNSFDWAADPNVPFNI